LAGLLGDCPVDGLRDPPRAVQLARKALEVEPRSSSVWVSVAHYRQGEWKAAVIAVTKGLRQPAADTGLGLFCLALSFARLGDEDQARRSYEQAVACMEASKPRHPELTRWRAEAGAVLRVVELARTK
jgi:Tfp pilus assembly protein PilF